MNIYTWVLREVRKGQSLRGYNYFEKLSIILLQLIRRTVTSKYQHFLYSFFNVYIVFSTCFNIIRMKILKKSYFKWNTILKTPFLYFLLGNNILLIFIAFHSYYNKGWLFTIIMIYLEKIITFPNS